MQKDLVWSPGLVNPSGVRTIAFFIQKSDIITWPEIAENPITVGEAVTTEGDFVLKAGAFWKRFYTTQGKGKVDFEGMGEKDCGMFKNKATQRYPDLSDEAIAYAKSTMNANTVTIMVTRTSGANRPQVKYVIIGGKEYDTEVKLSGNSGDNPGSEKGLTVEIEAPDFTPLPRYEGVIVLEDGSLDCETDIFTPTAAVPLVATSNHTDTTLGSTDGTITTYANGGSSPYQYSKDNGATYQSSNIFTGLEAATYALKVKDAANAVVSLSVTIA